MGLRAILIATAGVYVGLLLLACQTAPPAPTVIAKLIPDTSALTFVSRRIVADADHWWAQTPSDVTGDGIEDLVFISASHNASGYLGYRVGTLLDTVWTEIRIADAPPTGGGFAQADLETGDVDGDGDLDVVVARHPGETVNPSADAELYWYANPGPGGGAWIPYAIGTAHGVVQDYRFGDFNDDGRLDLAVLTSYGHNLRIHRQNPDGTFVQVADILLPGLRGGMDVGDLDGDSDLDLAANGYTFTNPGAELTSAWVVATLEERWHSQADSDTLSWLNATKTVIGDLNGDGTNEVLMSHAGSAGYPVAYYTRQPNESWLMTTVIDSSPALRTLLLGDLDGDGDLDLVTGVDRGRETEFGGARDHYPLSVLRNRGDHRTYDRLELPDDGIFIGHLVDFDGDGDLDLFRYPDRESTEMYLLVNQTIRSPLHH